MSALGSSQTEAFSRGKLLSAVAQANHLLRWVGDPDKGIDADIECKDGVVPNNSRDASNLASVDSFARFRLFASVF